jgi:hypothetical protein
MPDVADWISAFVAFAAFITSVVAYRSAHKSQAKSEELARRNAALLESQATLDHQSWADEYFREITHWACEVSTAISVAIHNSGRDDEERKLDALITLSACIDMGRWYFPNRFHDEQGKNKEPAYRGVRQPILDWVVRAYDILDGRMATGDTRSALVECQRQFVSYIQQRLDPRSREKIVSRILLDYVDVDKLRAVESPK